MPPSTPVPILILGPPRSGAGTMTTLLAAAASVALGEVTPPSLSRPTGTGSAVPVVMAHDVLFRALSCDWTCPPADFDAAAVPRKLIAAHVSELEEAGSPWAVTEHRLMFALPAWLDLIPSCRIIGVVRSATAMTLSIVESTGLGEQDAEHIVEAYLTRLDVLQRALGFPVVDFSAPAPAATARMADVAGAFGLDWDPEAARGLVRESLRNHRSRTNETNRSFRRLAEVALRPPQSAVVATGDIQAVLTDLDTEPVAALPTNLGPAFAERRRLAWRAIAPPTDDTGTVTELVPVGTPPDRLTLPDHVPGIRMEFDRLADLDRILGAHPPASRIVASGLLERARPDDLGRALGQLARHATPSAALVLAAPGVTAAHQQEPWNPEDVSTVAREAGWSLVVEERGTGVSVLVLRKNPPGDAEHEDDPPPEIARLQERIAELELELSTAQADHAAGEERAAAVPAKRLDGVRRRVTSSRTLLATEGRRITPPVLTGWVRGRNGGGPHARLGIAYPLRDDRTEERLLATALAAADPADGWAATVLLPTVAGKLRPAGPAVSVLLLLEPVQHLDVVPGTLVVAWVLRTAEAWPEDLLRDADVVLAGSLALSQDVTALTGVPPEIAYPAVAGDAIRKSGTSDATVDYRFIGDTDRTSEGLRSLIDPELGGRVQPVEPRSDRPAGDVGPDAPASDHVGLAKVTIDLRRSRQRTINPEVMRSALAGSLPVTNDVDAATDMFGSMLPIFSDRRQLSQLLDTYLADDPLRVRTADRLAASVRRSHTVARRMAQLHDVAGRVEAAPSVALKICTPDAAVMERWGDTHLARHLARALRRRGMRVRVDLMDGWYTPTPPVDVVVHLRGLHPYAPRQGPLNILWIISHPEDVDPAECERYDAVLCASELHTAVLADRVSVPVATMHQATDPTVLRFSCPEPTLRSDLLFVGNARRPARAVPRWLLEMGEPLTIYGARWDGPTERGRVRGSFVPNDDLHRYYRSADIVVNDHWPDMRENGFISNRIFDALACGAFVISDHLDAIPALFGDAVPTFGDKNGLATVLERFRDDPEARAERALAGRRLVLAHHTFDARAGQLDRLRSKLLAGGSVDAH